MVLDEESIFRVVGSLGFPIVVALYHMLYQERTLRKLTAAIERLTDLALMNRGTTTTSSHTSTTI